MFHHCELHSVWFQSELCMGSMLTTAVGVVGWSFGFIKDVYFRGLLVLCVIITSATHVTIQICDETNQSKGFAMIATMGGFGRLFVCKN